MNDIALWLPALLLPLFCLAYSITARRALYLPLPRGLAKKLRDQHTLFLAMRCLLIAAAGFSMAEAFGQAAFGGSPLHIAGVVLRVALFCLFTLYIAALPREDRRASVVLVAVAAAGVLVRAVWAAPVDLFFLSVSAFGSMVMMEREADGSEDGMSDRFRTFSITAIALTFFLVVVINAALILDLTRTQSDELGRIQLDVIRSDLQDTLSSAEAKLLHTAIRAEKLLDEDVSRASLEEFILDQRGSFLADESFMSIYIAGKDWHFVPDFDAPPDFHAAERVWYIGAEEHPGEVYITEPYKDVNTGDMCFTISTLLSDGETVVGMDLNFSKVQESIQEMTSGRDEAAVIVTNSGLIVGYTDMSLVGESASEKLPEYETVLSRVMASQAHDSFQMKLDGRPCVIFSSETSNHWYLILSVATESLYAESRRQIAALASVNLLMLLVLRARQLRLGRRAARQGGGPLRRPAQCVDRGADQHPDHVHEHHLRPAGDPERLRHGGALAE